MQSGEQPCPSSRFPSSQISGKFLTVFPQISQTLMFPTRAQLASDLFKHEFEHPSVSMRLPSSQFSIAAFIPSVHVVTQVWLCVPEQVYPVSIVQVLEHPLPLAVPPSSHCSVTGFKSPFPQEEEQTEAGGVVVHVYPYSLRQLELQPSPPVEFPSSQVSVPSITEFPQT